MWFKVKQFRIAGFYASKRLQKVRVLYAMFRAVTNVPSLSVGRQVASGVLMSYCTHGLGEGIPQQA